MERVTLQGLAPRRRAAKLTQRQFAELLNVDRGRVAMWETGKSLPLAELLPSIAALLNCSIDDLFRAA